MYDATDYAANLFNLPTVAYSGEIDRQKQAADMMEKALTPEGMTLKHIIGPETPHRYHPDSKVEIARILDALAEKGRDPYPRKVRFTTLTLRYNKMKWVTVDAIDEHWERARLDAEVVKDGIQLKTSNVGAFTLSFGPAGAPLNSMPSLPWSSTDSAWSPRRSEHGWLVDGILPPGRHDKWTTGSAFREICVRSTACRDRSTTPSWTASFLSSRPARPRRPERRSGPKRSRSTRSRMAAAVPRGRAGEDDAAVTDADIASSNLVLWGDPGSNKVLARIADKLPVKWIGLGPGRAAIRSILPTSHAPILIYPNPLNPNKYVVLNSGFTFREYDYLNNARQSLQDSRTGRS